MSYILDALKRAESERERGAVPGLHSQSVTALRSTARSSAMTKRLAFAATTLAVVLLLAVLAWRLLGPGANEGSTGGSAGGSPASPPTLPTVSQVEVAALAPPAVTATLAPNPSPAPTPTPTAAPKPKFSPTPAAQVTNITSDQTTQAGVVAAPRPPEPRPAAEQQPTPAVAKAPSPVNPTVTRNAPVAPVAAVIPNVSTLSIVSISDLPADIRQTLPKSVISGSTYSDNQALRMLIINGEVFREGEKPAPDLVLEQIRARSAVMNFKGLRYSVAY